MNLLASILTHMMGMSFCLFAISLIVYHFYLWEDFEDYVRDKYGPYTQDKVMKFCIICGIITAILMLITLPLQCVLNT